MSTIALKENTYAHKSQNAQLSVKERIANYFEAYGMEIFCGLMSLSGNII